MGQMSAAPKDSIDWKAVMGGITTKGSSGRLFQLVVSGGPGEPRELFRWPNTL